MAVKAEIVVYLIVQTRLILIHYILMASYATDEFLLVFKHEVVGLPDDFLKAWHSMQATPLFACIVVK